jgi:hypothetical protein
LTGIPATITGVLVVFTIEMSGQTIEMETGPELLLAALASTAAVTLAVLEIGPHAAALVAAVDVIVRVSPWGIVP